jgi:hypothetical protein
MLAITFNEITPTWLTAILTERGGLIAGRVLHVKQTRDPNPITQNATLLLTYSPDARDACPDRLFFKQSPQAAEARFYQKIAPTLAHSAVPVCYDAHWENFLYPHDPIARNPYLIDWAVRHVNQGVGDLAYNIALQCYPERRAWIEQPLIRRYHARLLANDIHDYVWAQCWEDHRRMVIEQCVWPIVWYHFHLSPNVWWFALECTLAAFEDLHCEEFL